ncbi:hypothetical protein [Saccharopolyspora shandongensis]|uniref:hypothetical protein n=1 Tax=Saccharopolyspora shandongensis TaxID=418495 RepID=UPI00340938FD
MDWEVFPNALSAALQYASLDWPTENGWVHYNALQQLAYFTTVLVATPLAPSRRPSPPIQLIFRARSPRRPASNGSLSRSRRAIYDGRGEG